jgi:hypothetical protein
MGKSNRLGAVTDVSIAGIIRLSCPLRIPRMDDVLQCVEKITIRWNTGEICEVFSLRKCWSMFCFGG